VVIARKPGVVEPVAALVLHVGPVVLASAMPERAGEIIFLNGDDVADSAVENAFDRLTHAEVVAPAETRDEVEAFVFGHLHRLEHVAAAGAIDRDRLLAKNVLAR